MRWGGGGVGFSPLTPLVYALDTADTLDTADMPDTAEGCSKNHMVIIIIIWKKTKGIRVLDKVKCLAHHSGSVGVAGIMSAEMALLSIKYLRVATFRFSTCK